MFCPSPERGFVVQLLNTDVLPPVLKWQWWCMDGSHGSRGKSCSLNEVRDKIKRTGKKGLKFDKSHFCLHTTEIQTTSLWRGVNNRRHRWFQGGWEILNLKLAWTSGKKCEAFSMALKLSGSEKHFLTEKSPAIERNSDPKNVNDRVWYKKKKNIIIISIYTTYQWSTSKCHSLSKEWHLRRLCSSVNMGYKEYF